MQTPALPGFFYTHFILALITGLYTELSTTHFFAIVIVFFWRTTSPTPGFISGRPVTYPRCLMAWLYLITAGVLEVIWAYSMKQSGGFSRLIPSIITVLTMIASFGLLAAAMRVLPLGTSYSIWTGIGAVGAFLGGVFFLGESFNALRVIAALLIISGLVLMKFSGE